MINNTKAEKPFAEEPKFHDAVITTPYEPAGPDHVITITLGDRKDSKHWAPRQMPLDKLIEKLSIHEVGKKDGQSFVYAELFPGPRKKTAVKVIYAIGLDLDNGSPTGPLDEKVKGLGCLAVRYSTHSHGKTISEFKKDNIVKLYPDQEIDSEIMRNYVRNVEKWDEGIVGTVEFVEIVHITDGIMVRIKHAPMDKNRVIIFLKDPYVIANEGKTQDEAMRRWSRYPAALAEKLGIPFDKSCVDPARIFFPPRHDKGKPYSISLFGGPLFDLRSLNVDDKFEEELDRDFSKTSGQSVTQAGKDLGKFAQARADGFAVVDFIAEHAADMIIGSQQKITTVVCPFADNHSSGGDRDTACFAMNADDADHQLFVVSCHHAGCQRYTMLDMLGEILRDRGINPELIWDPKYDAQERPEEEAAKKIPKEIAELVSKSTSADIAKVFSLMLDGDVAEIDRETYYTDIKTRTHKNLGVLRAEFAKQREERAKAARTETAKAAKAQPNKNNDRRYNGKALFLHDRDDSYDFDVATEFVKAELLAINAAAEYPKLCCMDSQPMKMMIAPSGKVTFETLDVRQFWARSTDAVLFVSVSEEGEEGKRKKVPEPVSEYLYHHAKQWMPQAPEVSTTPRFIPFGFEPGDPVAALVITPGYHFKPEYGMNFYIQNGSEVFDVPEQPTADDVKKSIEWLDLEILNDFSFNDSGIPNDSGEPNDVKAAGRANTFAMLLTPLTRELFEGQSPLFLTIKAGTGEGASTLARLPCEISEGRAPLVVKLSKDDEFSKTITSMIREARNVIFLDDVTDLNNKDLHRMTTSPVISGRLLGSSIMIEKPNRFLWVASGINPSVNAESARRILPIRLNSELPDAEARVFRHPAVSKMTLEKFVAANRAVIVSRLLTLIQYWVNKDAPIWEERTMTSYPDWARKVGGVLNACGIDGFLKHAPLGSFDPEKAAQDAFAQTTFNAFGLKRACQHKPGTWEGITLWRDLFDHQVVIGADIIEGWGEEERGNNFRKMLLRCNDRAFEVNDTRDKPDQVGKFKKITVILRMDTDVQNEKLSFYLEQSSKTARAMK